MSKLICQMYGFREEIKKDPYKCFNKIKDIGFSRIQLDGYRGHTRETILDAVNKAGLEVSSMHVKHDKFIRDVKGIIEDAKLFSCNEVYLKYIEDEFQTYYGYKFTKEALIKATEILNANGIKVGLHSPEYDFNTLVEGQKVMDYFCMNNGNTTIYPEPDTYWLSVAREDILDYCKKYEGKILTLHLKDINLEEDLLDMKKNIRECGKGSIGFEDILAWGYKTGINAFAIEQDYSSSNIFDSTESSYKYLRKIELECEKKF